MFCLGSIISAVYECRALGNTQQKIVNTFFRGIEDSDSLEVSTETASDIARGVKNPSGYVMEALSKISSEDFRTIKQYFRTKVVDLIKENDSSLVRDTLSLIILEDDRIHKDTVVEVISGTKKSDIAETDSDLETFLAGIFLFALKNTKNNVGGKVKREVSEYIERVRKTDEISRTKDAVNLDNMKETSLKTVSESVNYEEEQIEQQAVAFCMKYDQEKDFIPLCQIASITNPTRKHCREMFNEYNRCTRSVRKKILEISETRIINISDKEWWWDYLIKFKQDYTRYKLGAANHEYMFGQYFPKLLDYKDRRVDQYLEHVFPAKVEQPMLVNYKLDVPGVIDEYIYYRNKKRYKKVLEPPMEYFFRELNFGSCEEFQLVVVLALFIIGTCRAIPIENQELNERFQYSEAYMYNLKTAEDLFYQTLIFLYETYTEESGNSAE